MGLGIKFTEAGLQEIASRKKHMTADYHHELDSDD